MLKIGIVAGEPSGDQLGADLVRALRQQAPDLELVGIGGAELQAEGCRSLFPMERLTVMGIVEVARRFFELLDIRRQLREYFLDQKPDVFIGIDAPDFNLPLERALRAGGIRTVHYVSPTVWAWRPGRMKSIAKSVDLMLTLFPFEKPAYDRSGVPALYVGHPLARVIAMHSERQPAIKALGLDGDQPCVALLPGSRTGEIKRIAPEFLRAAALLARQRPGIQFIAGFHAPDREQQFLEIRQHLVPGLAVRTFTGKTRTVMAAADVILVASGTATLEAMLVKRPMVVGYRVNPVTAMILRRMIKTPHVALPNLLAGEPIVPEHLQEDCKAELLAASVTHWLDDPAACARVLDRFTALHEQLLQAHSDDIAERLIALARQ